MAAILIASHRLAKSRLALIETHPVEFDLPSVQITPLGTAVDVRSEHLSFTRVLDHVTHSPLFGLSPSSLLLYIF